MELHFKVVLLYRGNPMHPAAPAMLGAALGHGAPAAAAHPAPLRQYTLIQFWGRPKKRRIA